MAGTVPSALAELLEPIRAKAGERPPCACGDPSCDGAFRQVGGGYEPCPVVEARQEAVARVGEDRARVGEDLRRYARSWAELDVSHPAWAFMREVCQAPLELVVRPCLSLVLLGPRGTGKTQAAAMLVDAVLRAGESAQLVSWSAWWSRVKGSYGNDGSGESEDSLRKALLRPALVALDDVGSGLDVNSPHAWALFEGVVADRYDRGRPTVITTNLTPAELAVASSGLDRAGREAARREARSAQDLPSRAFSRLQFEAHFLVFDGVNFRQKVDAAQRDAAVAAVMERLAARS